MIDTVTKQRLGRTLSAQLYSQLVTVACQLALVPLLLWAWGTERYGGWLLLTAIPSFLTFSDFGFTFVAKNEMVIAVARGSRDAALITFQSIFALLNIVAPIVAVSAAILIWATDPAALLSIKVITLGEARCTLMLFVLNVLIYQYFLLVCAGIRAENRPAAEAIWAATSRLMESVAFGITAFASTDLPLAALAGLVSRIGFLVGAYVWLNRLSPWLSLNMKNATRSEITRLAHPATAYMLVPIAQALLIQGPVIVIGALMGPVSVVVFSTSRTLARVGTSVTNMFNNTFVTEYSANFGRRDYVKFDHLRRVQLTISIILIICYVVALTLLAEPIMQIFTHGKVKAIQPFFFIMSLAVAAEMFWSAQFTPLVAINRHRAVTYSLAVSSLIGIGACYPIILLAGNLGAALVLMFVHISMVAVCELVTRRDMAERGNNV